MTTTDDATPFRPPSALPPDAFDARPVRIPPPPGIEGHPPVADPPGYAAASAEPFVRSRPARRGGSAALLLLIFAGLELVAGGLAGARVADLAAATPLDQLFTADQARQLAEGGLDDPALLGRVFGAMVAAGCFGVTVLPLAVLAIFVRRGSRGAAITALVLVCVWGLFAAWVGLGNAGALLVGGRTIDGQSVPPPGRFAAVELCVNLALVVLAVALVPLLARVAKRR